MTTSRSSWPPAWPLFLLMGMLGVEAQESTAPPKPSGQEKSEPACFPAKARLETAPSPEQAQQIAAWISELGAEEYASRAQARESLLKLGPAAAAALRKAASTAAAPEVQWAAQRVLGELEIEVWEGYYYNSLEDFESACRAGASRVRFQFKVRRAEDGAFAGRSEETAEHLGGAAIQGRLEAGNSELSFDKQYDQKASHHWRYEGNWSLAKQRIEGTYGPEVGGFVLYPRLLTEAEKKEFEKGE